MAKETDTYVQLERLVESYAVSLGNAVPSPKLPFFINWLPFLGSLFVYVFILIMSDSILLASGIAVLVYFAIEAIKATLIIAPLSQAETLLSSKNRVSREFLDVLLASWVTEDFKDQVRRKIDRDGFILWTSLAFIAKQPVKATPIL